MTTSRADYRYILKELPYGEDLSVWALECYPETKQLPFVSNTGCMYLEMKSGVSELEANAIRDLLNKNIACITVID